MQRDIVKLQAMKDKLPDRMARFDQLKANFPGTAEIPALLDQIRDAAAQSGVSVLELKTSAPVRVSHDAKAGAATNGANGTCNAGTRRLTGRVRRSGRERRGSARRQCVRRHPGLDAGLTDGQRVL